eukprot:scaffold18324_cov176-Amphora_coffeaeformis.AAC.2
MSEVINARTENEVTRGANKVLPPAAPRCKRATGSISAVSLPDTFPRQTAFHAKNMNRGAVVPMTMLWAILVRSPSRLFTTVGTTF